MISSSKEGGYEETLCGGGNTSYPHKMRKSQKTLSGISHASAFIVDAGFEY
jgi:hypothetical protein